jgi:NDP-sugar pyrophosphorylase family protein
MKAIILAGGLGTRLKPFTEVIPKPLLPVGEKSVLEIQITQLRSCGVDEVILATNYKSEYIEGFFGDGSRYGVKLRISKEEEPLGTAGPLSLLRQDLTEPFIVMNGDILTKLDFARFYEFAVSIPADFTVGVKKIVMPFAFGNIISEGDFIADIQEKPDIERNIVAGVYVMKPRALELIPDKQYYGMDTLIKTMLKDGLPVAKYQIQEYWLDIGQIPDYEKAQELYQVHFKPEAGTS